MPRQSEEWGIKKEEDKKTPNAKQLHFPHSIKGGCFIETIRTTVLCACCTALGLTLAENILPLEQFERQIRMLLAILMMTAILKPLTKLDFSALQTDFSTVGKEASEIAEMAEQAREQAVSASIVAALNRTLAANDVPCTVYAADVHIQADGSIVINEVTAGGNLLTGTVFLREWLGDDVVITEGGAPDA